LKRSAFVAPANADLFVQATIGSREPGFAVRIELTDREGARLGARDIELTEPECQQAADAAALAVALMIDPNAALRDAQEAPPSSASFPAAPPPPTLPAPAEPAVPRPPTAPATPAAREEPTRVRLSVAGIVAVGSLPGLAPGVTGVLRFGSDNGRFGIDVWETFLPWQEVEVTAESGGRFRSLSGGSSGFWVPWRKGPHSLSIGAGLEIGSITGVSYGFASNRLDESLLLGAAAEVELALGLPYGLSVVLRPGLMVPFVVDDFHVTLGEEQKPLFEHSPLVARLSLGLALAR
jgi:hypothetical protein